MSKIVPARLIKLRKENHLHLKDLKEMFKKESGKEISISSFSHWESGVSSPRKEHLKVLSHIYNVPVEYLTGESDNKKASLIIDNDKNIIIRKEDLYRFRGEPVLIIDNKRCYNALVSDVENCVYLSDRTKIPFEDVPGTINYILPLFGGRMHSLRSPISLADLHKYKTVWVEETNPAAKEKWHGWCKRPDNNAELFMGAKKVFFLEDYAVKWLAFEDIF